MGLIAKEEGGNFVLIPEGTYMARCYRVIDLGTHYNEKHNKDSHKIQISWELPTELIEKGEYAGQPNSVHNRYTLSLARNAYLRQDLEAWRGKKFDEKELSGFDVTKLIGATCFLNIVHSADGKYANISSIMALPKGTACPEAINEQIVFILDEFNQETFEKLSEKMQEFIKESSEYKIISSSSNNSNNSNEEEDVSFDISN